MCLVAVSLPWMSEPFQSALMSSNLVLSLIRIGMPCVMSVHFSVKRRKPVCVSLLFFHEGRSTFIHCCCFLFYSFLSNTVCKALDHLCPNLHLLSIKLVKIMLHFLELLHGLNPNVKSIKPSLWNQIFSVGTPCGKNIASNLKSRWYFCRICSLFILYL